MKTSFTIRSNDNRHNYNNNILNKYIEIGDEKTWKDYIKK